MKPFAQRLVERNFKKRFIFTLIAAAVMLAVSAAAVAALCHTQISEGISAHRQYEASEKQLEENEEEREDGEREQEEPGLFDSVSPLPVYSVVILVSVTALWAALLIFYWVSVVEWLYKAASRYGLNRALWPILGGVLNIFAVLALLIIVNNPKRKAGNA